MTKETKTPWLLIGVGTQLTAMVVVGFAVGYFTDEFLSTTPVFMVIFGCLGFIGGILKVYKLLVNLK